MKYIDKLIERGDLKTLKVLLEDEENIIPSGEDDISNLLDGGQRTFSIRGYDIIHKKGIFWLVNPKGIIVSHGNKEDDMINLLYKIIN